MSVARSTTIATVARKVQLDGVPQIADFYEGTTSAPANDEHVEFISTELNVGDITLSTGGGQLNGIITLPAGRIYQIIFVPQVIFSAAGGSCPFRPYNLTDGVFFGRTTTVKPYGATLVPLAREATTNVSVIDCRAGAKDIEIRYVFPVSVLSTNDSKIQIVGGL